MKPVALLFMMIFLGAEVFAADPLEISRRLDSLYRAGSSEAVATMSVVTPNYQRSLKMRMWSRGLDYTLIRIMEPPKERGMATLKRGSEMWNFLPKINKTMRVPPSMMMSSWMGSDLTNDDLVRHTSWEKDYVITLADGSAMNADAIEYVPKPDAAVTWSKVVGYFDKKTLLPMAIEFFDEKGRKVRMMEFSEVATLGGRLLPRKLTVIPLDEDKKGNRTTIFYEELKFDVKIPADFFSQTSLREER